MHGRSVCSSPASCNRITLFLIFVVNSLSSVCNEATFEFSEFMALSVWLHVSCLWMSLGSLGQFLSVIFGQLSIWGKNPLTSA